jgi:hypothetical protein
MRVRSWVPALTPLLLYALEADIAVILYFVFVPAFLAVCVD